jgi:hypothetical protein
MPPAHPPLPLCNRPLQICSIGGKPTFMTTEQGAAGAARDITANFSRNARARSAVFRAGSSGSSRESRSLLRSFTSIRRLSACSRPCTSEASTGC